MIKVTRIKETNSPYQHLWKCTGNSVENIHTDVWGKGIQAINWIPWMILWTNMVNIYSVTPFSLLPSQSSSWEDFVCMDQDSVHRFDHCLICSKTVLTNSMSRSMQKSHWNLNHHPWNWRLFTCSLKMAVAPKPNEIFRLMNGRDHFHHVPRLLSNYEWLKTYFKMKDFKKKIKLCSLLLLPVERHIELRSIMRGVSFD